MPNFHSGFRNYFDLRKYLFVLLLAENGESRFDTLVQKQLQSWFPKLVHPLCVQAGVDAKN